MNKDQKIKAIIFDADGVVINSPGYFSVRYMKDFGVPSSVMLPFFEGKFQECLVGKADLKEVLEPLLKDWHWQGSVDELLNYWFKAEHYIDDRLVRDIESLRGKGIKCYLATKQEKYRTEYIRTEMGFENIFDKIYSSAEVGYKKPDERFYQFIQKDIGLTRPEEIFFWDDEQANVDAAIKLGWQGFVYREYEGFKEIMVNANLKH